MNNALGGLAGFLYCAGLIGAMVVQGASGYTRISWWRVVIWPVWIPGVIVIGIVRELRP